MFRFPLEKVKMVDVTRALPGRDTPVQVPERHHVNGNPLSPPYPEGLEQAMFRLGCFWGAERKFWEADGVWTTAVGYAAGFTPNPSYEEVWAPGRRQNLGASRGEGDVKPRHRYFRLLSYASKHL